MKLKKKNRFLNLIILNLIFILLLTTISSCNHRVAMRRHNFINVNNYDSINNITKLKIQQSYFLDLPGKWSKDLYAPWIENHRFINNDDSSYFLISIKNWSTSGHDTDIISYFKWLYQYKSEDKTENCENIVYEIDTTNKIYISTYKRKISTKWKYFFIIAGLKGEKMVCLELGQIRLNGDPLAFLKLIYYQILSMITDNRTYKQVLIDRKLLMEMQKSKKIHLVINRHPNLNDYDIIWKWKGLKFENGLIKK